MPNHCRNHLHLWGPAEQLTKFVQAVRKDDNTINIAGILPMPEILKGTRSPAINSPDPDPKLVEWLANGEVTQERYDELVAETRKEYEHNQQAYAETGYTNWYDWSIANWGTKWGDYDHFVDSDGEGHHEFGYHTAWAPFDNSFWLKVSALYPELTFIVVYQETGMTFAGASKYQDGVEVFDHYINDYTELLPDVDWDDDDSVDTYMGAEGDLFDGLYEMAESA